MGLFHLCILVFYRPLYLPCFPITLFLILWSVYLTHRLKVYLILKVTKTRISKCFFNILIMRMSEMIAGAHTVNNISYLYAQTFQWLYCISLMISDTFAFNVSISHSKLFLMIHVHMCLFEHIFNYLELHIWTQLLCCMYL